MHLSYVTVSVDYSDYLAITLRHNRPHFDDMIVVTAPRDRATQELCAREGVRCVVTDAFYHPFGVAFNKGAGLNAGLAALKEPQWVAIFDADTFVHPTFRQDLEALPLDIEWLYGTERVLLPTYADYIALVTGARSVESFESPRGFAFGWMQLIHWGSHAMQSCVPGEWYPQGRDCTEVDWRFFRRWGNLINDYAAAEGRIAKLPFKSFNLGPHGVNHQARRSPAFVPSIWGDGSDDIPMGGPPMPHD
jgi:hypothetical protein